MKKIFLLSFLLFLFSLPLSSLSLNDFNFYLEPQLGTDFGAIDARISSQLSELESKILEISPIKTVNKVDVPNPDL